MKLFTRLAAAALLLSLASVASATGKIAAVDYCDPDDAAWAPTGGCLLKEGDVTLAEFNSLLTSMFSPAVVGHPGWAFEPSFVEVAPDEKLRVRNEGGRMHTFTEVAAFGGGFVPPLSIGLLQAPECAAAANGPTVLPAGEQLELRGLAEGNHLFQCCIHPWMRAMVRVEPKHE